MKVSAYQVKHGNAATPKALGLNFLYGKLIEAEEYTAKVIATDGVMEFKDRATEVQEKLNIAARIKSTAWDTLYLKRDEEIITPRQKNKNHRQ